MIVPDGKTLKEIFADGDHVWKVTVDGIVVYKVPFREALFVEGEGATQPWHITLANGDGWAWYTLASRLYLVVYDNTGIFRITTQSVVGNSANYDAIMVDWEVESNVSDGFFARLIVGNRDTGHYGENDAGIMVEYEEPFSRRVETFSLDRHDYPHWIGDTDIYVSFHVYGPSFREVELSCYNLYLLKELD